MGVAAQKNTHYINCIGQDDVRFSFRALHLHDLFHQEITSSDQSTCFVMLRCGEIPLIHWKKSNTLFSNTVKYPEKHFIPRNGLFPGACFIGKIYQLWLEVFHLSQLN